MKKKTFRIISLGCSKNTVDSDSMAQLLYRQGYRAVDDAEEAQVMIVNTCGFIHSAREESLQVLSALASEKSDEQVLVAAGCLTQRYGSQVAQQVDGLDGIIGTRRWMDIMKVLKSINDSGYKKPVYHLPEVPDVGRDDAGTMRVSVQGASAYLKIADGCRRPCAFCAIPLIKGTAVSRPMDAILKDARKLQEMGVREIVLIAQDTTDYGHDLGMSEGLTKLLDALVKEVPDVDWIRLMYAYPGYVTDRLIETMARHEQIVPYLDIPLQHAHPKVLRRMRRPANMEWVYQTIDKMRQAMPDLAIRTTFIVGYPDETEEEFQTLMDFLREMRFDRVGAFQYSFEKGTPAEYLGDTVPAEVKQERWERLMALQQGISHARNETFVGRTLKVLVEGYGDGITFGRSYRDAPEIDGLVMVEGEFPVGEMVRVEITEAMDYDLIGKPL